MLTGCATPRCPMWVRTKIPKLKPRRRWPAKHRKPDAKHCWRCRYGQTEHLGRGSKSAAQLGFEMKLDRDAEPAMWKR